MMSKVNNIVVFGPAHVGKSSLCGYIITRHLSYEAFAKKENKIKMLAGNKYKIKDRFSYFVDKLSEIKKAYIGTMVQPH